MRVVAELVATQAPVQFSGFFLIVGRILSVALSGIPIGFWGSMRMYLFSFIAI